MRVVRFNRKTAPKVRNGRVQKKNNHGLTLKRGYVIDRQSPRRGFRHLVTKQDVLDFIRLIPDGEKLMEGVRTVLLSPGDDDADGYYLGYSHEKSGVIELAAWDKNLTLSINKRYFQAHRDIFERLHLKYEIGKDNVTCWFDEAKAKAFLLVHIFVHELGHHRDFMARRATSSGEPFAEGFANQLEHEIWPRYVEKFGQP